MNLYEYVKGLFTDDPIDESVDQSHHQDRDQTRGKMRTEVQSSAMATSNNHTEEQRRYFTGTVTSLNEDGGMIDNHVYFDLDSVIGGKEPFVGGAAHVTATRPHVHAGWRATRVDLLMEWHPGEGSEIEIVVGLVSGWSHTRCVVESGLGEVTFAPNEYRPASGYRPHIGDSIEVGTTAKLARINLVSPSGHSHVFHDTHRKKLMGACNIEILEWPGDEASTVLK